MIQIAKPPLLMVHTTEPVLTLIRGQAKMERMLTWMLAPAVHGIPVPLACTWAPVASRGLGWVNIKQPTNG